MRMGEIKLKEYIFYPTKLGQNLIGMSENNKKCIKLGFSPTPDIY